MITRHHGTFLMPGECYMRKNVSIHGNPFVARKLDYILCNSSLLDNVGSCEIIAVPDSDHRAVYLDLQLLEEPRGPSYWKFNDYLLQDESYVEVINNVINETIVKFEGCDDRVIWNLCKIKIRENSIAFSKTKAKLRKNKVLLLRKKLETADKTLAMDPTNESCLKQVKVLQEEMELLNIHHAKGAQIRSRTKWMGKKKGKRIPNIFLRLEKARTVRNTITQLKTDSGNLIDSQNQIHHKMTDYYKEVYKKKVNFKTEINQFNNFISNLNISQISNEDKTKCDEIITLTELVETFKLLNNKSAPGHDGLTPTFYKHFWPFIGPLVHASFIKAFHEGLLSLSQRRAIIIQIHKGKNLARDILKNWRPISLTNTDYKILAKALALRIQHVLNEIVNEDQVGIWKAEIQQQ